MLNERLTTAREVASLLFEAERANDRAIVAAAKLTAGLLEARLNLNLAACVGQNTIEEVAATMAEQISGRRRLVTAHANLAITQREIGLGERAFGGGGSKQVPTQPSGADLTLVASRVA
jgi:hypothetical protein